MASVSRQNEMEVVRAEAALAHLLDRVEELARLDQAGELIRLESLPALTVLQRRLSEITQERDQLRRRGQWLRDRLTHLLARQLEERGVRRIAIYGAGYHTAALVRQPWRSFGIEVIAVLDDSPRIGKLSGLPVMMPNLLTEHVDAVVISSDSHEATIERRAREVFGSRGIPVYRIYGPEDAGTDPVYIRQMLVERFGVSAPDADWLVANRMERHDAMLPMLPPRRTEMHLRRYEFAAPLAAGGRVLDCACGTGYGSRLLADYGNALHVLGVDVDARTIDYAKRRYADPARIEFVVGDAEKPPVGPGTIDLIASFETVEHVVDPDALMRAYATSLAPNGALVISTPNDLGVQPHHHHSFTLESFRLLVMRHFLAFEQYGQVEEDEPRWRDAPPGIYPLGGGFPDPEVFIFIARTPKRA